MTEGAPADCAYIIASGKVEVSKRGANGEVKVIGMLSDGDIFGEMGLIDGLPRSASVTAIVDCSINVLTKEVFNNMSDKNPKALVPILKVLTSRLRATLKLIENTPEGTVRNAS